MKILSLLLISFLIQCHSLVLTNKDGKPNPAHKSSEEFYYSYFYGFVENQDKALRPFCKLSSIKFKISGLNSLLNYFASGILRFSHNEYRCQLDLSIQEPDLKKYIYIVKLKSGSTANFIQIQFSDSELFGITEEKESKSLQKSNINYIIKSIQ